MKNIRIYTIKYKTNQKFRVAVENAKQEQRLLQYITLDENGEQNISAWSLSCWGINCLKEFELVREKYNL